MPVSRHHFSSFSLPLPLLRRGWAPAGPRPARGQRGGQAGTAASTGRPLTARFSAPSFSNRMFPLSPGTETSTRGKIVEGGEFKGTQRV